MNTSISITINDKIGFHVIFQSVEYDKKTEQNLFNPFLLNVISSIYLRQVYINIFTIQGLLWFTRVPFFNKKESLMNFWIGGFLVATIFIYVNTSLCV